MVNDLINNDERVASSKKKHCSRQECKNHTIFMTKMAKLDDTLRQQAVPVAVCFVYVHACPGLFVVLLTAIFTLRIKAAVVYVVETFLSP